MHDRLGIAAAQPRCVPYDLTANALAHATAVRSARSRVVVFPEMSLTGYELDAPAVGPADPRLAPLVDACARTGSVAFAGAPVEGASGRPHIATLMIDGDGVTVAYRKVWLGDAEAARFAPGAEPVAVEVDGLRLGLAVCKDLNVARHARDTAALGIDVYVAAALKFDSEADAMAARAREIAAGHGVWAVVAAFAGPTGGGYERTTGRSGVWAPGGEQVAQAGPEPGDMARATITRASVMGATVTDATVIDATATSAIVTSAR
ncbi:carbon-nitrogen hydrolase family protein [Spongiactinospora sp. TRM90649]|uniref:carbon-nitrogen hydrolase family protein n=1 Tax=Spongiactinospora sp. TRM90649 TaxID=3031114 RepID=UPI0023F8AB04|nr:carbon-nitrogen hydrolase family protein [Spongiactinospora sp. TRM90649]MDF5752257.1 carbon-nitrogen hydrolase family protein [Spongiactinospora sp. TRM90649]